MRFATTQAAIAAVAAGYAAKTDGFAELTMSFVFSEDEAVGGVCGAALRQAQGDNGRGEALLSAAADKLVECRFCFGVVKQGRMFETFQFEELYFLTIGAGKDLFFELRP